MRQAIEQMMKATYNVVTDVHALTDSVITVAEKNFPTTEFRVNDDGKISFPISQTMVGTIARNLNGGTVVFQVVENGNVVAEAVLLLNLSWAVTVTVADLSHPHPLTLTIQFELAFLLAFLQGLLKLFSYIIPPYFFP